MKIESTPELVKKVYETSRKNLKVVRSRLNRPLTYAEKVLYGHLEDAENADLTAGTAYIKTRPDRVALQDATAQMAILQFMLAERETAAVPVTIHCDHLIRAHTGAKADLDVANHENNEVYNFLASSGKKYGFGFWKPGAGIIHQVVLEQYAFPGLMMLGTDSHTPNAGGLGAFASGVGGADAVDVMVDMPWEVLHPNIVGVKLTGELKGWASPKDVILKLLGILTCAGGTNRVIEYFGEGVNSISCTGKATICNMGAELGATTSIFPYDDRMKTYLGVTGRDDLAALADEYSDLLEADAEVVASPEDYYEKVIEINLSELEPHVVGPHSPDLAVPVSGMAKHMAEGGWPVDLTSALIGSCTNSSYEDMGRVATMVDQVVKNGGKLKMPLLITPGSEQVRATIERDGIMQKLEQVGATVLANACGPCIGQWQRDDIQKGTENSIISSYNRNFPKRNDGNPQTCSFIGSPETTFAYALTGRLDVNPFEVELEGENGTYRLNDPQTVAEVPANGFVKDEEGYQGGRDAAASVDVAADSKRLQILAPFDAWSGSDYEGLPLLMKAKGKCTTDHISPAGPWLRFRGHLDNISDNMFSGAINAFTGEAGMGVNQFTGEKAEYNKVARDYKSRGLGWVAVGDVNYGEGSSREHAAMCPRNLGARAVITRSFARIHETNLKKQGVLPLTFVNPADYNLIEQGDKFDIKGLTTLAPGSKVTAVIHHADGGSVEIELKHSLNAEQIEWFKAGSALNAMKARQQAA